MGEETEVADAHEAWGEHVEEKAPQELLHRQGHQALLVGVCGVSPAKGDLVADQRDEAMVHDLAIFTALAAADMHDHALAVDIADLEPGHLGATRAGSVEGHHQDAVEGGRSGVDEPGDFLLAEDGGQATYLLGVWGLLHPPALLESLEEEEAQGG